MKVARVATIPFVLNAYRHHFELLENLGAKVTLITSPDHQFQIMDGIRVSAIEGIWIERDISILKDLRSVWNLYRYFKKQKFEIVHSMTPKAGLVCAIAGTLAGVPVRLHTYTGQRWETLRGIKRAILKYCDWLIGVLCHRTYADSPSQMQYLIDSGIIPAKKIACLGEGSFGGIDLAQFEPLTQQEKNEARRELSIPDNARIISFLGRVVKDKGVVELVSAFKYLSTEFTNLHLILIGPLEMNLDPIPAATLKTIQDHSRIHHLGYVKRVQKYLGAADFFCLPSYREGFPTSTIEAAAMGLPTVGTSIVGLRDAVLDGKTGILVKVADTDALTLGLRKMILDLGLRQSLAVAAAERARRSFSAETVSACVFAEYRRLVSKFSSH